MSEDKMTDNNKGKKTIDKNGEVIDNKKKQQETEKRGGRERERERERLLLMGKKQVWSISTLTMPKWRSHS